MFTRNGRLPGALGMVFVAALMLPLSASAQETGGHGHDHKHGRAAKKEAGLPHVPPPDPNVAKVPEGYRVEIAAEGLTYPSSVAFDDQGQMYVAEAGYSYGDETVKPRLFKFSPSGQRTIVTDQLDGPVNDLLWHQARLYISHRGKISVLEEGRVRDLVTGLPSLGDHHNNQMTIGPDGKLYFGQGTATNSGVVGLDNYKMGWLKEHSDFHDVPARDLRLVDRVFTTKNPLKEGEGKARTSAYHPFDQVAKEDLVKGQVKASGTILRMNLDGTGLDVYAWGLRNPYGVIWGPDDKLYATENGFDVRGSRPIADDREDLYEIKQGAWYGWPDFASGIPVTEERFVPKGGPKPEFLMKEHPAVEKPLLTFPKHSAITKADFSPGGSFGHQGQLFVAFFGHMSPMTGEVEKHGGHRVVAIDLATNKVETFFTAKHSHGDHPSGQGQHNHPEAKKGSHQDHHAPGQDGQRQSKSHDNSHHGGQDESISPGPRRLVDVRFSPEGDALYVVDFGSMVVDQDGPKPIPGTGLVWRIERIRSAHEKDANSQGKDHPSGHH